MRDFHIDEFFPKFITDRITDIRIHDPDRAMRAAKNRHRRSNISENGRLTLLIADHSARSQESEGDALASNRRDYLARIVRVLLGNAVDGLMASMDVFEELLLIHDWLLRCGCSTLLDHKLMILSLHRGLLDSRCWGIELLDSRKGSEIYKNWGIDGVKIALPLNCGDSKSIDAICASSRWIADLNSLGLFTFLEPTLADCLGESTPERLARSLGLISSLGDSSRYLWLQLPYCSRYGFVAQATTLPILMLGEGEQNPIGFLEQVSCALRAAENVRGTMLGRNMLYPVGLDPLVGARALDGLVHKKWEMDRVKETLAQVRDPLEGMHWSKVLHSMRVLGEDPWFPFSRD